MPASQHSHLSELPIWLLFILASLSGIAGEMWRAEALGLTWGELAKRILLRCGASAIFGVCAGMLVVAFGASELLALAVCSMTACLGADITGGIYGRWLSRKAGLRDEHA